MRTESVTGPAAVGKLLQQLGRQFVTAGADKMTPEKNMSSDIGTHSDFTVSGEQIKSRIFFLVFYNKREKLLIFCRNVRFSNILT